MKRSKLICLVLLLLVATGLNAQQTIDARGAGMGFSNAADTRGLGQVGLNPAMLALHHRFNFEFNLLSANVAISNNSLSRGQYNQYFTTGDSLSLTDKNNIFNSIPSGGLSGNAAARINTFAVYMPRFSLSLTALGRGYVNLPREIAEIGLFGNSELDRAYDFSTVNGSGWGGAAVTMSMGFPASFLEFGIFDKAAFGMSAKYIIGLQFAEVTHSEGHFHNVSKTNHFAELEGIIEARRAKGGSGFGYDFGIAMQSGESFTLSAALLNAFGSVNWNKTPESYAYTVKVDSFAVNSSTFDDGSDSVFVTGDSSFAVDPFSTRMPAVLDLGAAYHLTRKLTVSAEYEQGLNATMGALKYSRFAFGSEFTGIPLLPLRAGMSFGGPRGFSTAFGLGLNLKYWFVDLGLVNHGGFSGKSSRGFTVAATTRFRF